MKLRVQMISAHFILFVVMVGPALEAKSHEARHFGVVTVSPAFHVNGKGKNIDSIAFWEAPDHADTLMLVTAKRNSLVEVWKYPFVDNEQSPLINPAFVGSRVNGIVVDHESDLLYVSVAQPVSATFAFKLPQLELTMRISRRKDNLGSEPNLALMKLPGGEKRLYISADDLVYIHNASGRFLGQFIPGREIEMMVGDNFHQVLYIPDENGRTGVYAYSPDGAEYVINGTNRFGEGSIFDEDAEGIVMYACAVNGEDTGEGLIVVADQRKDQTDFEVFDRKSWKHVGTVRIEGVSNTDGIASTQQALPCYPLGLFAAVNNDTSVVGVGWHTIFEAIALKGKLN
jgi:hypothetical protein